MTVHWLIWDAASIQIADRMMANDRLPNLERLVKNGEMASLQLRLLNAQTPSALTAQFTGQNPAYFGIGGYNTPIFENDKVTLKFSQSFINENVKNSVLWNPNNIGDKKTALCQIPFGASSRVAFDGYSRIISPAFTFNWNKEQTGPAQAEIADETISIRRVEDCTKIWYEIYVNRNKGATCFRIGLDRFLNPKDHDVWVDSAVHFKVYAFTDESLNEILLFTDAIKYDYNGISDSHAFRKRVGGFIGKAYGRFYRQGRFGPPRYKGGGGRAEEIYRNLLWQSAEFFSRLQMYFQEQEYFDFIVAYQPCIDEMSHEIYGWYANAHNQDDQKFYYEMLCYSYDLADRHLGKILDQAKKSDVIFLTSDHGIYSVLYDVYLNVILKNLGFLTLDSNGRIDLASTKAFYHPAGSGALFFHADTRRNERIRILKELMSYKINGVSVIKGAQETEGHRILGDFFLQVEANMNLLADLGNVEFSNSLKTGCHTMRADDMSMRALFATNQQFSNRSDILYNTDVNGIIQQCLINS
jgi:hypothetical protein